MVPIGLIICGMIFFPSTALAIIGLMLYPHWAWWIAIVISIFSDLARVNIDKNSM